MFYIGAKIEDLTIGREERGDLAWLNGTESIGHADQFSRVKGQAFNSFL